MTVCDVLAVSRFVNSPYMIALKLLFLLSSVYWETFNIVYFIFIYFWVGGALNLTTIRKQLFIFCSKPYIYTTVEGLAAAATKHLEFLKQKGKGSK